MAGVYTSQTGGVTSDMLEEARRRMRERGQKAPYAPSMSGLSEREMERSITQAQLADQPTDDAVAQVRDAAQMRLRAPMSAEPAQPGFQLPAPMTGAPQMGEPRPALRAPGVAPEAPPEPQVNTVQKAQGAFPAPAGAYTPDAQTGADMADRAAAVDAARRRRGIGIAGAIATLFGERENDAQRMQMIGAARDANDPNQYLAAIQDRATARDTAAQAERDRAIADEERALNADYRHTLMRSMDTNADRREFEMDRRVQGDARLYDPQHPAAMQRREFLRRVMSTAPEVAEGFRGQDLDALGAADLRSITDQMLRRIGQVPNRLRQADIDEMRRIAAELDAGDMQPEQAPAVEEPPHVAAARGRRGVPAAPVAPAEPPPAYTGAVDRSGSPPPWASRGDRTVAQMNAERLIARNPNEYTWGEALNVSRGLERSRTRTAASLAGGIDTQSREAQFDQTGQQGAFSERDIERATRITAPLERQSRQLRGLLARVNSMDDETFRLAMQNHGAGRVARALNFDAADFAAQYAAYANPELRERSGAAVTDSEYQRFVQEMGAGTFNSRAQFISALNRVLNEVRANSRSFNLRPDLVAHVRQRRTQ